MGFTISYGVLVRYTEEPGITAVTVPKGVRAIGGQAFMNCRSLTTVFLPEGVTEIGPHAFMDCSSLTTVVLPEGVTTIGPGAFADCVRLTELRLPASVKEIGICAFSSCMSLVSLCLPEGVETIGQGAFARCKCLTEVVLPESLRTLRELAFLGCDRLTSVTFPSKIERIGDGVFDHCLRLTTLRFRAEQGLPSPAQYRGLSVADQIDMCRLFQRKQIPTETKYRILCTLLCNGCREPAFLASVKRSRSRLLEFAVSHDDVAALRLLLAMAPLKDEALEKALARASAQGARACYIVLVNEKQARGLLTEDERRL